MSALGFSLFKTLLRTTGWQAALRNCSEEAGEESVCTGIFWLENTRIQTYNLVKDHS